MKKLKFSFIFVVILSILLLAACSDKEVNTGNSDSDGLKGEITIASWAAAADSMEETAEIFMSNNPGTTIKIKRVGHDYQSIIPPLTSGKGAPDIVHIEQRDFQTFLRKFDGQFKDVSDVIGDRKDEFAKVAWEAVEKDGAVYGVPWDLGPAAVWYRSDYYEKANIDVESIKTWDDFIKAGKELQAAVDGVKMVAFDIVGSDPNPSTWMILMNQLGGEYTDASGNINFSNEANVKAMEMVKEFKDQGIVSQAGNWDELVQAVSNGKTASVILPVWFAGTISGQAKGQDGKWNVMPLPAFEAGGSQQANLGGGVLAITKGTKDSDLAEEFLKFALLTNEGQDVQMKYGLFPSWQPYYGSEGFQKEDEYFGFKLADFFGSVAQDIPILKFGPYYMDFHHELKNAYGDVMNNKASAEEALENAGKRAVSATGLKSSK